MLALVLAGCGQAVAASHATPSVSAHATPSASATVSSTASSVASASASSAPSSNQQARIPAHSLAASMAEARAAFTATLLENGRVLVAGGFGTRGTALASAEIYDPVADRWSAASSMSSARALHTATLLADGKVLVVGGVTSLASNSLASAEIYDPSANSWSAAGQMRYARAKHAATLLADGTVLVAGGTAGTSLPRAGEIYNPAVNAWAGVGGMIVDHPDGPMMTRLLNGQVLLFGGTDPNNSIASGDSVEGYDPGRASWAPQRNYPSVSRDYGTATVLNSGLVLVVGGEPSQGDGGPILTVDVYDPNTMTWNTDAPSHIGHCGHTATLLKNGDVLVVGGHCGPPVSTGPQEAALSGVEVYRPGGGWTQGVPLTTGRGFASAVLLQGGQVLVAGGFDSQGSPLATAELYTP